MDTGTCISIVRNSWYYS